MTILEPHDTMRLKALAAVLLPETAKLPSAAAIQSFDTLLSLAVKASAIPIADLRVAIGVLPDHLDLKSVEVFAATHPVHFENLSVITSGAYVMASEVLERLGFPADRRNPAGPMEAADEYETGILEPVINREPVFRDPRRQ
jgi:hypothetical protein